MEQLTQKYIKYFYMTLIGIMVIQLMDTIVKTIQGRAECNTFLLIFLSIINLTLLLSSLVNNIKQRFTECKMNAKILRLTIALLMGFQMLLHFQVHPGLVSLGNHLSMVIIIEIIINYRIKSIENLEERANQFAKTTTPD